MSTLAATQDETFFASREFESAMMNDDGLAARQHLAAGRPIYYGDNRYPEGIVKEYPDGHMQLVSISDSGVITVIRDI